MKAGRRTGHEADADLPDEMAFLPMAKAGNHRKLPGSRHGRRLKGEERVRVVDTRREKVGRRNGAGVRAATHGRGSLLPGG